VNNKTIKFFKKESLMIEKHDLLHELPEHKDAIHHLKMHNNHFAKLFEEYHNIDHEIKRIEIELEPSSDVYLEDKKKNRLHLKDELYKMILKEGKLV
jgi:uncharacterized protein YdcH (DUF465 family)